MRARLRRWQADSLVGSQGSLRRTTFDNSNRHPDGIARGGTYREMVELHR